MVTQSPGRRTTGSSTQASGAAVDTAPPDALAVVDDLSDRAGFDTGFLGVDVPVPRPTDPAPAPVDLPYTHFTVVHRPDRRLAAVTAVGVDGETLLDLDRAGIDWRFDPRLPQGQQLGEEVYARNSIDRGHLVRRRDPVWGPPDQAALANADTFHYTNAAPQAGAFNQGEDLWLGLEDYLLATATTGRRRLVVFTGPVLTAEDPLYRGVAIPTRFFKVAAFLDAGVLAATAYVLDQTPQLEDATREPVAITLPGGDDDDADDDEAAPPLGAYRTYQVPVADVAALTGLGLEQLVAVDRLPVQDPQAQERPTERGAVEGALPGPLESVVPAAWRRMSTVGDVVWRR